MAVTPQGASVLINGEPTRSLDCADRGLHYGDGIFTTLTARRGVPLWLGRHLARLQSDAARLGVPFPGHAVLAEEARQLAARYPDSVLKIMLTQGAGGRGYRRPEQSIGTRILSAHPLPDYPGELWRDGVDTRLCELRLGLNSVLAGVKHLNRLEQVLARAEWGDGGIREGLLLDGEGFLVEGVTSNLFLLNGGRLQTPLLDRCGVAGVMRGVVVEAAQAAGLEVEEARLLPRQAFDADGLFLTNSVIGIWPVRKLDAQTYPVGETVRMLARRIEAMIAGQLP